MKDEPFAYSGSEIRALRKELGLSQLEFANRLGYSRAQTVSDYETAQKIPNQTTMILIHIIALRKWRV